MTIYLAQEAQIALLLVKEVTILEKYLDFADIFSKKSAKVLCERTKINKYIIKLEEGKQPLYNLIYSLGSIKLEILMTYI